MDRPEAADSKGSAAERRPPRNGSDRRSPASEISASAAVAGRSGDTRPETQPPPGPTDIDDDDEPAETDDPAFAALQRLFPGRVVSVEAPATDEVDGLDPTELGEGGEAALAEAEFAGEEDDEESRD